MKNVRGQGKKNENGHYTTATDPSLGSFATRSDDC